MSNLFLLFIANGVFVVSLASRTFVMPDLCRIKLNTTDAKYRLPHPITVCGSCDTVTRLRRLTTTTTKVRARMTVDSILYFKKRPNQTYTCQDISRCRIDWSPHTMYTGRCGGWVLQLTHLNGFGDVPSGQDLITDLRKAKNNVYQLEIETLD